MCVHRSFVRYGCCCLRLGYFVCFFFFIHSICLFTFNSLPLCRSLLRCMKQWLNSEANNATRQTSLSLSRSVYSECVSARSYRGCMCVVFGPDAWLLLSDRPSLLPPPPPTGAISCGLNVKTVIKVYYYYYFLFFLLFFRVSFGFVSFSFRVQIV